MQITITPTIDQARTISAFEILAVTDDPINSTVTASVSVENVGVVSFVLWSGAAYDAIGQWTDTNAQTRTLEIINATY